MNIADHARYIAYKAGLISDRCQKRAAHHHPEYAFWYPISDCEGKRQLHDQIVDLRRELLVLDKMIQTDQWADVRVPFSEGEECDVRRQR